MNGPQQPNVLASILLIAVGCAAAAMFLAACYPSAWTSVRGSAGGTELVVLIAIVAACVFGIGLAVTVLQAAIQLFVIVAKVGLLLVCLYGGVKLWQQRGTVTPNTQPGVAAPTAIAPAVPPTPVPPTPPPAAEPSESKWWEAD